MHTAHRSAHDAFLRQDEHQPGLILLWTDGQLPSLGSWPQSAHSNRNCRMCPSLDERVPCLPDLRRLVLRPETKLGSRAAGVACLSSHATTSRRRSPAIRSGSRRCRSGRPRPRSIQDNGPSWARQRTPSSVLLFVLHLFWSATNSSILQ